MNNLDNCYSLPLYLPPPAATTHHPKRGRTKLLRNAATKPSRKPDPAAPKITDPCTECGKRFWSWKALFGHMRCHPKRQWRGIHPPLNLRAPPPGEDEEEREVAACLLILANQGNKREEEMGHKCSVCRRDFSSGQALGGHMRCHREIGSSSNSKVCGFDLNLPFNEDDVDVDDDDESYSSALDLRLGL